MAPELDAGRVRIVGALVVAITLLAVAGLVLLWPTGRDLGFFNSDRLPTVTATLTDVAVGPCAGTTIEDAVDCFLVTARVTSGPQQGEEATLERPIGGRADLRQGDRVRLAYNPAADPPIYYFYDFQRTTPLLLLVLIFVAAVLLLGGWRGLGALSGLGASVLVLVVFTLPAILEGRSPVVVALVSATIIAVAALCLAHGPTPATGVALLGTLVSLLLTGVLAAVFVAAVRLTGLTDENALLLDVLNNRISLSGIILAGIVIGSLGVLDDVTVTQVTAVGELAKARPDLGPRSLFDAALRIGRDHISSTVNTLVLAYAGAALPLLLLFTQAERKIADIATSEVVAIEIVRALVGSIGLVASVPITTALAVWVRSRPPGARSGTGVTEPPTPTVA